MLKSIRDRIAKRYQQQEFLFAVGFMLTLGLLAYLPFIHRLGFYRDDWYVLWAGRALGPNSIIDLFAFDRPAVGYIYSLVYRLLGENALWWQLYSLGLRLVGALSFLWMLRRLWPQHKVETMTAATLMFIYPGFLQWANAMTKSNHLTTYTLALVSLALTVAALQSRSRKWNAVLSAAALFSAVGYWFLYEYMIGLEGLRLMLIGLLTWRRDLPSQWTRLRTTVFAWAPYLLLIGAHITWRLLFFESGRPGMSVDAALSPYQDGPLRTLAKRLLELIVDSFETVVSAWAVPLNSIITRIEAGELVLVLAIGLTAVLLFAAYYLTFSHRDNTSGHLTHHSRVELEMTAIGGLTVISTLLPVIAVGRDVRWVSGFDKYTLHTTAGVAMFLVGAASLFIRSRRKWVPFALLIGIATATQTGNAIEWQKFWEDQKDLWWQVSWRAPLIKDETLLLVEMPGKDFFEAYEIWGPANLVYAPAVESIQISAEVFSEQTLEKIRVGQSEVRGVRSILDLERNFLYSLILSRPERSSCWHVLDGDDPVFPEATSPLLYSTVRRSGIGRIAVNAPSHKPPEAIFGAEPDHGWCYYFQKASLAAQQGDWQRVVDLGDQALDADLKPIDRSEWMPFLRGYIMTGRDEQARAMSLWVRDIEVVRHRQCDYLSGSSLPDPDRQTYLREMLCE